MSDIPILERVLMLVPIWLSLTVHEFSHGWSAWKLGDGTAKEAGRLTLNPLAHIDPIGTFLLPLMGVPFGWAKPVPVNPARFDRKWSVRKGMLLTAAAGPASNFLLALLSAVVLGVVFRLNMGRIDALLRPGAHGLLPAFIKLLIIMMQVNVALGLFNLIPVFPLDGSRIADFFIPERLRPQWEKFCKVAPILLIIVFVFGAGFLIERPAKLLLRGLLHLVDGIAGY